MKELKISKGYFALVDDEDYEFLSNFKWSANVQRHTVYAKKSAYRKKNMLTSNTNEIMLHRMILKPKNGEVVDHIDGNGLNNQKVNLRLCKQSENLRNKKHYKNNSSGVKGVYFNKQANKWIAQIGFNKKMIYLGSFINKHEAAQAYKEKSQKLFGEFVNK